MRVYFTAGSIRLDMHMFFSTRVLLPKFTLLLLLLLFLAAAGIVVE